MAMNLSGIPVFTIMLIGRWSSDAFLQYIHQQVQQFSFRVSNQMISSPDFFSHNTWLCQQRTHTSLDMLETLLHVPILALMHSALCNDYQCLDFATKWSSHRTIRHWLHARGCSLTEPKYWSWGDGKTNI
jgi:hypothetical protein